MADYVSTLTGAQMDAALLDMAEHNSEAWAVGERNGIDVPPDDVAYHNNARYYAQIATSTVPAGDIGDAVRWGVDQSTVLTTSQKEVARNNINAADNDTSVQVTAQTFTTAQQEIARANIRAGASNRNLLDNPWFTVNQRGFTTGITSSNYSLDRWRSDNAAISYNSTDKTIYVPTNATFRQNIEPELYDFLVGKTVTLSVKHADGTIQSGKIVVPSSGSTYAPDTPRLAMNGTNKQFFIYSNANVTIKALKLELGSYSTLANDVPPDYGEELLKCLRSAFVLDFPNYGSFGMVYATSATAAYLILSLPVPMRARPSLSYSGSLRLYDPSNSGSYTVSNLAVADSGNTPVGNNLMIAITSSNLTAGKYYVLTGNGTAGKITLSADL